MVHDAQNEPLFIIAALSATKNEGKTRDPEMHSRGKAWHFGMKAHIGVDAASGQVHSLVGTAAHVGDITQAGALLHGEEEDAFGDAGYRGVHKAACTSAKKNWSACSGWPTSSSTRGGCWR